MASSNWPSVQNSTNFPVYYYYVYIPSIIVVPVTNWNGNENNIYEQPLTAILTDPNYNWVPSQDMDNIVMEFDDSYINSDLVHPTSYQPTLLPVESSTAIEYLPQPSSDDYKYYNSSHNSHGTNVLHNINLEMATPEQMMFLPVENLPQYQLRPHNPETITPRSQVYNNGGYHLPFNLNDIYNIYCQEVFNN